jgi:chemotaxis protein CheX
VEPLKEEQIVSSICAATSEVFGLMLNLEITPGEPYREPPSSGPTDGVIALLGLAGQWAGTGIVQCDATLAGKICSRLLAMECEIAPEVVSGDVLDAIAELANMIIGNVKNSIEEQLGLMGMSIPTVVFGHNFATRGGGSESWTVVPFACEQSQLIVKMCLRQVPEPGEDAAGGIAIAADEPALERRTGFRGQRGHEAIQRPCVGQLVVAPEERQWRRRHRSASRATRMAAPAQARRRTSGGTMPAARQTSASSRSARARTARASSSDHAVG